MIQNIIWDVDGTLFDTYPAISRAFHAAVRELGGDAPMDWILESARKSLGYCTTALAERCHLNEDEVAKRFNQYYDQVQPTEQPPFSGVLQICQYIQSVGGKNLIVTHRGTQGLMELLEAHQMKTYFQGWITRDDGFPKKPDPAAFEATILRHHLSREETLAVGDREIDIQAGKRAGLLTCLFDPENLAQHPDLKVNSFETLYEVLLKRAASPEGSG